MSSHSKNCVDHGLVTGKEISPVIIAKRIFDVCLALVLGVVLSPVLLGIAVVLKATSPGPLLFRQRRLGKGGSTFLMNKFRKFPSDMGTQGPGVTLQFDSRMTGIGRILERTKLDELPQLWNILLGEMSFVGPRPESLKFRHLFTGEFADVLSYKPGIFGPNQTKYRNESAMYPADEDPHIFYERVLFPDKARNDLQYFGQANFRSDLWCIISGVFALLFNVVVWRSSMRPTVILLAWDVLSVLTAWMIAFWLKYSVASAVSILKPGVVEVFRAGFIIAPCVMLLVFLVARVYRHPVRYFSGTDLYRLVGACGVSWILTTVAFGVVLSVREFSSLMLAVVCVFSICLMVLPRLLYKEFHSLNSVRRHKSATGSRINLMVYGVSEQSSTLCKLLNRSYSAAKVVGVFDDDPCQLGREIQGFRVLGMVADLDVLNARYDVDQVWIASDVDSGVMHKIASWCEHNKVSLIAINELAGFQTLARMSIGFAESRELSNISTREPVPAEGQKANESVVA